MYQDVEFKNHFIFYKGIKEHVKGFQFFAPNLWHFGICHKLLEDFPDGRERYQNHKKGTKELDKTT